jgi:uncharacterized protein
VSGRAVLAPTFAALALLLAAAPAPASAASRCGAAAPAATPVRTPLARLTGRVVDDAHILSGQARARLAARLRRLEAKTTDQLVVVTLRDLRGDDIAHVGLALGNGWGIGRKGLDNGVLLIIAPRERKVRIEVGCGLEGLLTDARARQIVDASLLPLLRKARYDAAAEAGARRIAALLESDPRRPRRRTETMQ